MSLFSGSIGSGQIGPFFSGCGAVTSGAIASGSLHYVCRICNTRQSHRTGWLATRTHAWAQEVYYCKKCVNWSDSLNRPETRLDWIRESVPLAPDAPLYALADWLEEWSRPEDAQYVRNLIEEAK